MSWYLTPLAHFSFNLFFLGFLIRFLLDSGIYVLVGVFLVDCEQKLFRVVQAITNDLNMYMWGTGVPGSGMHTRPFNPDAPPAPDKQVTVGSVDALRRFDRVDRDVIGRPSSMGVEKEKQDALNQGRGKIDCGKFRKDLKDVCYSSAKYFSSSC